MFKKSRTVTTKDVTEISWQKFVSILRKGGLDISPESTVTISDGVWYSVTIEGSYSDNAWVKIETKRVKNG